MKNKIHSFLLLVLSVGVLMLAFMFFSNRQTIEVQAPLLTKSMADNFQAEQQQAAQKRQQAEAARKRAEQYARMKQCQSDDECIIVDQDPCGCLKGPEGVTAINSNYSLEFSNIMSKRFAVATTCPSVASIERECAPSAKAICQENHCQISY